MITDLKKNNLLQVQWSPLINGHLGTLKTFLRVNVPEGTMFMGGTPFLFYTVKNALVCKHAIYRIYLNYVHITVSDTQSLEKCCLMFLHGSFICNCVELPGRRLEGGTPKKETMYTN